MHTCKTLNGGEKGKAQEGRTEKHQITERRFIRRQETLQRLGEIYLVQTL